MPLLDPDSSRTRYSEGPDKRGTALSSPKTGMTATEAALREVTSRNDELIDAALIRGWLAWGLGWLLFFSTLGAFTSTKFNYPEFFWGAATGAFRGGEKIKHQVLQVEGLDDRKDA